MTLPESGIYVGSLRHRRLAPVAHAFTYPLFMVLLDVDRIPDLMRVSWLAGHNRFAWASFHDADHLGDPARPLRQRLSADAARHGHTLPDGPVFLLTHLRYLGYGFNPVSFYYCHDGAGALRLVLAEVHNTFGGAHNYWLAPIDAGEPRVFRATASKAFYVSPFMPAQMDYAFALTAPLDDLAVHMSVTERDGGSTAGHRFDATLSLSRRPWTAAEMRKALLRHPAMTARVIAGIHWQALRLWLKHLPIVPRPTPDGVVPELAAPRSGRP